MLPQHRHMFGSAATWQSKLTSLQGGGMPPPVKELPDSYKPVRLHRPPLRGTARRVVVPYAKRMMLQHG